MRQTKTVLMFPYANHLGGTQPLVAIGGALRDAGHNVVFAARGKCTAYIEECGFEVEDVVELDRERSVAFINKSSLGYHTKESIAEFVEQESALIRKHKADAVVDLHRPTLKLSALLTKTPRAVLCNTVLTRYYAGEKFLPESHPLSSIVKHLPDRILRPVSAWAEDQLFRSWVKPYNAYLKGRSDVRFETMKDLFEGDATILMDAPEFAPSVELPAHVHAVGPLVHEQKDKVPDWYSKLDPSKKSVFVYLGSYGEQFSRIVDYLGRLLGDRDDFQVVAATGGLYEYDGAETPANVIVSDYVPASLVLSRNCAAMITHGGRGSIYSALHHGVPLVGIPNQGEQEWNLDAVERHGVGRKLSARRISFEAFDEAMRAVIDEPRFRENADAFGRKLRNYDGVNAASRIIVAMA
ncbi:MAG TPA: nucleotide disphospho-sugar-binding domain-containing protein [Rhodanobacteraceae bacterium]|nr:nucleotide disphospho-sugar-binding domain-containing protein [Rhodanobacteraceae bacterium]